MTLRYKFAYIVIGGLLTLISACGVDDKHDHINELQVSFDQTLEQIEEIQGNLAALTARR